jgi:predicted nucleotidyltransferase
MNITKKMTKDAQFITTSPPDGAEVFVFGSATRSSRPSDLDVLVVYDTVKLAAETVGNHMQEFFADLASATGLKVHAVLLSRSEENQAEFIVAEGAIPLEPFWAESFCTKRRGYQDR